MARVSKSTKEQGRRPMIFDVLPPLAKGRGFRFGEGKKQLVEKELYSESDNKISPVKKSFWQELKHGALAASCVIGLVALIFFLRQTFAAFENKTAHVEFFANSVRSDGSWKNIEQALGEPTVASEGARTDFSADNSAIYEGGRYSLVAENFTTREFIKIDVAAPISNSSTSQEVIESTSSPVAEESAIETPIVETQTSSTSVEEINILNSEPVVVTTTDIIVPSEGSPVEALDSEAVVEPVAEETPAVDSGFENHLPASENIQTVVEPTVTEVTPEVLVPVVSESQSEPMSSVEPVAAEAAPEVSAPAPEPSASEPVSKLEVLKKELADLISPKTALAQADISADDRDTTFGHFRAARVKISLAAFNKAMENSAPIALEVIEQLPVESVATSSLLASSTVVDIATSSDDQKIEEASSTEDSLVPLSRLFKWFGMNKANAQAIEESPKAVIWYSVDSLNGEDSWQELYTVTATDLSNAENGGYLVFSAPFIKAWQDIDNLKIKFQGRSQEGENFVFYLDAVWVEADYDQVSTVTQEGEQQDFDKDVLEVDGEKIVFEHTDENVGENLIIKTNRKNYFGLSNADIYFSVENTGVREEDINLQFYFPSATSGVVKLEKLVKNSPYISQSPRFEPKIFECANGWEKREAYYECYPTDERQVCDVVSPNRRYCRIENFEAGVKEEIKYKNRWSEIDLSNLPLTNEKGFWQKVLALGPQEKDVPEGMEVDKATRDSIDKLLPGEVRYYKASIHFAPNSEGEFYIEAIGNNDGYGLLDPWWNSGWNFRMPINVSNAQGSETLTDYQVYVQVSSTSADFWRNIKADGGDIRFLDSSESVELDFWTQYFDRTASSAAFWVQVPLLSAASSTKIYLYYGNSSANSASSQYAPFTYSTAKNLYHVVSVATSTSIEVVSLIDGNTVQIDGGAGVNLDRQGRTSFLTYTASSTISAKGPIGVKVSGGPATAPAAPVSFASTDFILPIGRDLEIFNFLPVTNDATVSLFENTSLEWQESVTALHSRTAINSIATDSVAIISATEPILVSLTTNFPGDGLIAYPPSGEDLYGIKSQYNTIAAFATSSFDILCSSRASSSISSLSSGLKQNNTACSGGGEGTGDAVRINTKSGSLAAIQQDDGDGRQETVFLPFSEFGSEYMLPTDAAYIVAVCAPKTGDVTLSIYDQDNFFVSSATCSGQSGRYPGVVRFGADDAYTYAAGTRIVSSNGQAFYAYYEDVEATGVAGGDETNLWGAVQARGYGYPQPILSLGGHEIKGPPTGVFNSLSLLGDGSGRVNLSLEIDDSTNDDCRAKLEYYADINCHGSPLDPTLSEDDASTTADFADPKVYNDETYQIGSSTGWIKTASGSNTILLSWPTKADLPSASGDYCLKLTANDQLNDQFYPATTSLRIDNLAPSVPGALSLSRKNGASVTLSFAATSTETYFSQYKIYYKVYDGTAADEGDSVWASSSDADLGNIDFNHTATTTVTGLTAGLNYSFNIFTYDQSGNKASSSAPINVVANDAPVAYFNSVQQNNDGSGSVSVSIEVDDSNDNPVRVRIDSVPYSGSGHCDFSSPVLSVLDNSNISSDFGVVHVDNNEQYQLGTTSYFILTSPPGANTVEFHELSKINLDLATGTFCLRITANDGFDDQLNPATTTLMVDNLPPVPAGNLVINGTAYNSILLSLPSNQRAVDDNEPAVNAYKIFYRVGTVGVSESDLEHDSTSFNSYDFAGATSSLVTGLSQGTNYVFNIWSYDLYGNRASSTEVYGSTDGVVTNKGLTFIDGKASGTSAVIAVANGSDLATFRAQVQDSDGWGALDYVILRLANSNDNSAPFNDLAFKWDVAGDDFSEIGSDVSSMASISPLSSSNCSDATCYLDFKIIFNKSFAATSTLYSAELYSSDTGIPANTDSDIFNNVFEVRKIWLDQNHYRWRNDDGGG